MKNEDKIKDSWSSIISKLDNEQTKKYSFDSDDCANVDDIFSTLSFPVVKRVFNSTLSSVGKRKSKIQQLKEDRINKFRLINGEEPNVILPDDEYFGGIIPVMPLSAPNIKITYFDFVYNKPDDEK